jgi:CRISPR-associated endonuclease/helicase Cas3
MSLIAHSANESGKPQPLREHLDNVAGLAAEFARPFGASGLARIAGLAHDLGKASSGVQAYLRGETPARRGPDHSSAGAVAVARVAELLAFVVAGHHGGLPEIGELKSRLATKAQDPTVLAVLETKGDPAVTLDEVRRTHPDMPSFLRTGKADRLAAEMFIRILFSALVDADALDTEAHGSPDRAAARTHTPGITELTDRLENDQAALRGAPKTPLNDIRNDVYAACGQAASQDPGFFTLTVPTGGGKTRASLGFGLHHAHAHDLQRVIVAIPYTSIIEQTAQVYRQILGDEAVVEHHSAIAWTPDQSDEDELRLTLATDNWDAPLVVTTSVQLFESLFSNRPGRCRKLHNIARSVIVLDEVQTLPESLLAPIVSVLNELVAHYGCTVLFCTATQPALSTPSLAGGIRQSCEIARDPTRLFETMRRVTYELPCRTETWPWDRVADEMRRAPQALCVVNSRSDAMTLLDAIDDPDALHLSTLLCGAHRLAVLDRVRRRLAAGEPCRLVSTQVVEAGVDLDFDLVLRAIGPLDRIVQAAGRCNREGRRERGRVVVFEPEHGHAPPGPYRSGSDIARNMLADLPEEAIDQPATFVDYYSRLYTAADTDRHEIQKARGRFDFPAVAMGFRIIPDDGVPVVVTLPPGIASLAPGRPTAEQLIAKVAYTGLSRSVMRQLQPHLVTVRRGEYARLVAEGTITEIVPNALGQWRGRYDPVRGLNADRANPERLVV